MSTDAEQAARAFATCGDVRSVVPMRGGHINDSFIVTCGGSNGNSRYLLQRVNDRVFRKPREVIENIERVTRHIFRKLKTRGTPDENRRVLSLVPTKEGDNWHSDAGSGTWRMYRYIDRSRTYETVDTAEQAYQAGRAFGEFQSLLADYAGARLHETIPGFHDTPARFAALERAVESDCCNRAKIAAAEIDLATASRQLAGTLADLYRSGELPERIVHNDAKISNLLFDEDTREPLCVVDLDTVMPGLALWDFGDMARSMLTDAAEDETDLSLITVRMPVFKALARGYIEATSGFLTEPERSNLVTAAKVITFEQGVRFLADYLSGDVYYKTSRPSHNLDRCRTQFKLLESISNEQSTLQTSVQP